jgi:hypothetical protein
MNAVRPRLRDVQGGMLALVALVAVALADDTPALPKATSVPNATTLEQRFEQQMKGVTLSGFFTVTGKEDDKPLKEEKYTIEKVTKLKDNFWLFTARIQYGKHDVTLSLPLEVMWAGDTPVITLSEYAVPGFGKFTCRILLYDDRYAGTWSGGDHGGNMFGRLIPAASAKAEDKKAGG